MPERRFGGLGFLAVDMCASNRVLLRFGPVRGPVRKAEIVLRAIPAGDAKASRSLPAVPFEIGAYEVREAWEEGRVCWDNQPGAAEEPAATARTGPGRRRSASTSPGRPVAWPIRTPRPGAG